MKLNILKNKRGITLIEVMMAVSISTFIILILTQFSNLVSNMNRAIDQGTKSDQVVDYVLETLVSEIRSMGQSGAGAYPLEGASSTSITFYSDIDRDGLMEKVRYFFATSTLDKAIIHPINNPVAYPTSTEIIISQIQNIIPAQSFFEYFDQSYVGSGIPLSQPIDLLKVRVIKPTIYISAGSSTPVVKFSQEIVPRNLKTN